MPDTIGGVFANLGTINTGAILLDILLTTLVSLALGAVISVFHAYMDRKKGISVEFSVTICAVCSVIALIIAVIGTNIASAFSLAGIMSVVRFRSSQQRTSDIAFLFVAMATGLTVGLGLYVPALVFALVVGALLNVLAYFGTKYRPEVRVVRICVPESMSYSGLFDDLLAEHALTSDLKRVRLISSGSVTELSYRVTLRDAGSAEKLLAAIRERNMNLNVALLYDVDDVQ